MLKKIIILFIVFIGAMITGWFLFRDKKIISNIPIQNIDTQVEQQTNEIDKDIGTRVIFITDSDITDEPAEKPEWFATDKDHDGLTDEEEQSLGTDIYNSDSDADGISDIDEVQKYKTDPMNPDTDGDSYWDGLEILKGYNPLGSG